MSTSYPILPRPLIESEGSDPRAGHARAGAGGAAAHALPVPAERAVPPPPRSFAQALAASQSTGWDPREVWLNRVYKPREGRRTW